VTSRADEYRRRAQQCIEISGSVTTPGAKVVLLEMAQHWMRLAEQQDRPVQQQQQLPPDLT
jgi:hypothetical protein